jgi:hypothetical protein
MTDTDLGDGESRSLSMLYVKTCDAGIAIGITGGHLDGWIWREAKTFQGALDALEKAIQGGEKPRGGSGPKGGKKQWKR